jgi:hypothetical protein
MRALRLLHAIADSSAEGRLRRSSTRVESYQGGQHFSIVRVPQRLVAGVVDVGHISLLVKNPDGSTASVGFYAQSFRNGMVGTMVRSDSGILVSPDPLYARAAADPSARAQIVVLHSGTLRPDQAAQLNEWTDDSGETPKFELTEFTTSEGRHRERAVVRLDGEHYVGVAAFLPGTENCATWVERRFPGCISCPLGLPRLCRAVTQQTDASPHSQDDPS